MAKIDRILTELQFVKIKLKFSSIKSNETNIAEVYENNLTLWYYENSDTKKNSGTEIINRIIKNPKKLTFCRTIDGFKLTEDDFIEEELKLLNTLQERKLLRGDIKRMKIYRKWLEGKTSNLDKVQTAMIENNSKKHKPKKTLQNFITNVKDKNAFIKDLKINFNTEKGINLKILIEILKDESIISIKSREFKQFYNCLKEKFNGDIGSYTALNDLYKHTEDNKNYYKEDIKQIGKKLNPLLTKHKTN